MKKVILLFLLTPLGNMLYAQQTVTIEKGCAFFDSTSARSIVVSNAVSPEISQVIDKIMRVTGLPKRFIVFEAPIGNAIATKIGDKEVIVVDPEFIRGFQKKAADSLAVYFILAHEIAHHYKDHLDHPNVQSVWWDELAADEFAGRVIKKLNFTIATPWNLMVSMPVTGEHASHPSPVARIKSAINGFCDGYYEEVREDIAQSKSADAAGIAKLSQDLERYLNRHTYNKASWERNIRYRVVDRKIIKIYESAVGDGYRERKDTIDINKITKVYSRWHDPGEIAFDCGKQTWIETFHSAKAAKTLKPGWYFDNDTTLEDDYDMLIYLQYYIAKLQGVR